MEEIYRLVRALRASRLPRNRHFEAHASAEGRSARRIHRFLRGIERDLRRSQQLVVATRADGGLKIELGVPSVRFRRTIELDASACAVLMEDPETALLLQRAQQERAR